MPTGDFSNINQSHCCPNCGYCPCCGRPYYNQWYPYQPYPWYWQGGTSLSPSVQNIPTNTPPSVGTGASNG